MKSQIVAISILAVLATQFVVPSSTQCNEPVEMPLAHLKDVSQRWALYSQTCRKLIGMKEKELISIFGQTAQLKREQKNEHSYIWEMESHRNSRSGNIGTSGVDLVVIVRNGLVVQIELQSSSTFH